MQKGNIDVFGGRAFRRFLVVTFWCFDLRLFDLIQNPKGFFNNWQNLVFQGLSCFSMLCQAMLHYVTLCYLMLYYAMMCSVFSIYALLCYVCLCCASKKRLSLDMTPSLSFFWVRFRCGPGLGAWIASSEYGVKAQSPSQSEDP